MGKVGRPRGAPYTPRRPIVSGETFGELTALRIIPKSRTHTTRWLCRCSCGVEIAVISGSLRGGNTGSCGCKTAEWRSLKHGMTKTPTYRGWHGMRQRCANPKATGFKNYGGRGIKVCERWLDFENFLADMGERPEGRTLDRFPNNDGNYEPGNCRWATSKQQADNKRREQGARHSPTPKNALPSETRRRE